MTDYNYVFGSLRDENFVAEIPLHGTYMDLELNVGGRFDGSFNLDMTGYRNDILLEATVPGKTWVVAVRDGQPIWGGFVWSRTYQSQAKSVQLFASSFEKYPMYQLIRSSIADTNEQRNLFIDLWTHMQGVEGRNINVNVPDAYDEVIYKTVDVLATDFKYYSEVMSELADATDGFDWYIRLTPDGPTFRKDLVIGYPTVGQPSPDALTFDYPGSILNYYATESMSVAGTNVFTLGSGEGSAMIYHESTSPERLAQGWPRWDTTVARKDIINQDQIDTVGESEGNARRPPMMILKPTIKGDAAIDFGGWALGDACRVAIVDPRFPNGFQFQSRITKWALQPQSADNTDEYAVYFENDDEGGAEA